jgi:hypothetical protein
VSQVSALNLAADVAALCNEAELVEKHYRRDERRRAPRIVFNSEITVYSCDEQGQKNRHDAYSIDISRCGMAFVSLEPHPQNEYVVLGVPRTAGAVMLPARVASCDEVTPGIYRTGVAFCLKARGT